MRSSFQQPDHACGGNIAVISRAYGSDVLSGS